MIEVYYWEDDDEAEDLFLELRKRRLEFEAILLDAEVPNATPSVTYKGKTYWDFHEFLNFLG